MTEHWLTILGIGAEGTDGLGAEARRHLASCRLLVGGARHLALAASLAPAADTLAWRRPVDATFPLILARRPEPVVVLASGDPFCFGVGAMLAPLVPAAERRAIPVPSSASLAAALLGWPLQDVPLVSLCGRPLETVVPYLQPGRRLLVLSADGATPALLAGLLASRGGGASRLTVMERLGAPGARIRTADARLFPLAEIDPLNLVALEIDPDIAALPIAPGLDDSFFPHDGPITTPELRAIALSALAPHPGELLWDVGAGSGSIGIEWVLRDPPTMRAIAFERDASRAAAIGRNASALGAPDLPVVGGEAPASFADALPAPDAVFVGGGGRAATLRAAFERLRPGGRIVAHSVTIETDLVLAAAEAEWGGNLLRVAIERAGPIGPFRAFRPSMTVTQWSATKP